MILNSSTFSHGRKIKYQKDHFIWFNGSAFSSLRISLRIASSFILLRIILSSDCAAKKSWSENGSTWLTLISVTGIIICPF